MRATTSPTTAPRPWLKSKGPVGLELTYSTWVRIPFPSSLLPHSGPAAAIGSTCACNHTGFSRRLMKPGAATEMAANDSSSSIRGASSFAIWTGARRSTFASLRGRVTE